MPDNPINPNPGVTPIQPTPQYGQEKVGIGEGEEAAGQKPFSLPPEPGKTPPGGTPSSVEPSPMAVAEGSNRQKPLSTEELSEKMDQLQTRLKNAQTQLQNPHVTKSLSEDHYQALNRLTTKMNPDMQSIAQNSGSQFSPPTQGAKESPLSFITNWLNGSQQTLGNAVSYLSTVKKPDIASYLKLQYSVQRATQRGELFASIIGSSVSGIKTLMSTQLG